MTLQTRVVGGILEAPCLNFLALPYISLPLAGSNLYPFPVMHVILSITVSFVGFLVNYKTQVVLEPPNLHIVPEVLGKVGILEECALNLTV